MLLTPLDNFVVLMIQKFQKPSVKIPLEPNLAKLLQKMAFIALI